MAIISLHKVHLATANVDFWKSSESNVFGIYFHDGLFGTVTVAFKIYELTNGKCIRYQIKLA